MHECVCVCLWACLCLCVWFFFLLFNAKSGRNEELAIELLNLVNNKAALMRQVAILTNTDPAEVGDPSAEVDRVRAIVAKNATGRVKVRHLTCQMYHNHDMGA